MLVKAIVRLLCRKRVIDYARECATYVAVTPFGPNTIRSVVIPEPIVLTLGS